MKTKTSLHAPSGAVTGENLEESVKKALDALGVELAAVDQTLVACVARRLQLNRQVLRAKRAAKDGSSPLGKIVRRGKERQRVQEIAELAAQLGVEPTLLASIEYMLIGESVKVQVEELSGSGPTPPDAPKLRQNLLGLAASVAASYGKAGEAHGSCPATEAVQRFETDTIAAAIDALEIERDLIVDVGCANGQELFRHAKRFSRGLGLDVSPEMVEAAIEAAKRRPEGQPHASHPCTFINVDVESTGIPVKDGQASFAIVNNGTGSDFLDLPKVLAEIARVLRPGGRFFASFHNAAALASQGTPLPWVSAMRAVPDRERHTVLVRTADGRAHEIHGRAYSRREVEQAMPISLQAISVMTFPHTLSLLPSGVLANNPGLRRALRKIDRALAASEHEGGSYLMVSGIKV